MNRKSKLAVSVLLLGVGLAVVINFFANANLDVLNPAGQIGEQERSLMIFTTLLALIIVIPVFGLAGFIVWKYREGNKNAKYNPNWDHSPLLESIWWAVPLLIISILAVITWKSSHDLDPFKPLASNKQPVTIQVVALQWKWLFIYPEQNIASVNYVQMPINTPINFQITSDAPMNSFWIPRLGGQIYAMSGMSTQLHLMADQAGTFNGSSANISGRGFAGMTFKAQAVGNNEFNRWVGAVQHTNTSLSSEQYNNLAQPSENNKVALYSDPAPNLYDMVMMKYMGAGHQMPASAYNMPGMKNEHSH